MAPPAPAPVAVAPMVIAAAPAPKLALSPLGEAIEAFMAQQGLAAPRAYTPGQALDVALYDQVKGGAEEAARDLQAPEGLARGDWITMEVSEALGIGALAGLFDDPQISQIAINGPDQVYIVRDGRSQPCDERFSGNSGILRVLGRLFAAVGTPMPHDASFAEAYLADGTRVHAVLPQAGGPYVTIDRPSTRAASLADYVNDNALNQNMAAFLEQAVRLGRNIVVSSNDVDARFEFISAMLASGASDLRVICVEGGGRLSSAGHEQLLVLSGAPGVDHTTLLQQALKMRPDRLVLADSRGPETFLAITALGSGVNGGIIGVNAESPDDALIRLVRQSSLGVRVDDQQIDAQIRENVDVLVQLLKYNDGVISVTNIFDLDGEMREVFNNFQPTGHVPRWIQNAQSLNHDVDLSIFN